MNFRFLNETVTWSRNTRRESERYVAKETRHSVRCNIHDLLRRAFTLQESKRTIGQLFSVYYTFYVSKQYPVNVRSSRIRSDGWSKGLLVRYTISIHVNLIKRYEHPICLIINSANFLFINFPFCTVPFVYAKIYKWIFKNRFFYLVQTKYNSLFSCVLIKIQMYRRFDRNHFIAFYGIYISLGFSFSLLIKHYY